MAGQPIPVPRMAQQGISLGDYTEVANISVPSESNEGEVVNLVVRILNHYTEQIGVMVGGALEYGISPWPPVSFTVNWVNVAAGAFHDFSGSFIMPNAGVLFHAYSYFYGSDLAWHVDDERVASISLGVVEPVFSNLSATYRRV